MYLSYDIKGIQQFIFSVPRLKCVIGGSGLIANFDAAAADRAKEATPDALKIVAAGGRGIFHCADRKAAHKIEDRFVRAAGESGLDIRIGIDNRIDRVLRQADRLYAFTPDFPSASGGKIEPCAMSGLWPVRKGAGEGRNKDVHPVIWERVNASRNDALGAFIIKQLEKRQLVPDVLNGVKFQFFRNVSPDPEDIDDEEEIARAGQNALGSRNRWAVIAMDGNDIGSQFKALERETSDPATLSEKFSVMSQALETCTLMAFLKALSHVIKQWAEDVKSEDGDLERYRGGDANTLILPFRPLLLGGDDITLLCHAAYAMTFVRKMAQGFQDESQNWQSLWPATKGKLTMSAGILYTHTSFPLHMSLPYTEELLRNAKNRFREESNADETPTDPSPAAVDWDSITETLVDTPEARRQRELFFEDSESEVRHIGLTRRPYSLAQDGPEPKLKDLYDLKSALVREHVSPSVLARVLPALKRPWSQRVAFIASVAKRHPILMQQLWEGGAQPGAAWVTHKDKNSDNTMRVTGFPDALLLLEEEHRMTQTTTEA